MTLGAGHDGNYLALDVGKVRIGVALASKIARLPHPHGVLPNDEQLLSALQELCHTEHIGTVVVGLPRSLDGDDTEQTRYCRELADEIDGTLGQGIMVTLQDEALTSRQAEAELEAAKKQFKKADIDALAAVYILEDYLKEHHPAV